MWTNCSKYLVPTYILYKVMKIEIRNQTWIIIMNTRIIIIIIIKLNNKFIKESAVTYHYYRIKVLKQLKRSVYQRIKYYQRGSILLYS